MLPWGRFKINWLDRQNAILFLNNTEKCFGKPNENEIKDRKGLIILFINTSFWKKLKHFVYVFGWNEV